MSLHIASGLNYYVNAGYAKHFNAKVDKRYGLIEALALKNR